MITREVPQRLTVGQVAKMLGCHPKTIDRKLGSKGGSNPFPEPHWIGLRRCWFRAQIEAWAQREAARPASERRYNLPTLTGAVTP